MTCLVLASASPRRAELLRAAGIAHVVHPAHVNESVRSGEPPARYVQRVALEKARAAATRFPADPVLAADTAVVIDGQILGKPADPSDARRMLRMLSGRSHQVLTGVTLIVPPVPSGGPSARGEGGGPGESTRLAVTTVEFAPLTGDEIDWYVSTGEPMDKAGAYAVQGLASRFVTRLDGSYSNVVGLPVALVYGMCREAGLLLS